MKNKKYALPLILIGLAAAYIVILVFTSRSAGGSSPDYTVFNTRDGGVGLFYDTLKEMGYPVVTGTSALDVSDSVQDIHVLVEPSWLYFSDTDADNIRAWVRAGGRLVYLTDDDPYLITNSFAQSADAVQANQDGSLLLVNAGLGMILCGPSETITNAYLLYDRTTAATIAQSFDKWGYNQIIFDEYYHGYQFESGQTLWHKMPSAFRILTYQLGIIVILLLIFYGRRFGKPLPYYEETEREENEYMKTLADTYQSAGLGEAALESHYTTFLKQCEKYFHQSITDDAQLAALWASKNLPHANILARTQENAKIRYNTRKRNDRTKFSMTVKDIETLAKEIQKTY